MNNQKTTPKTRYGFLGIKLSSEALDYEIRNYQNLSFGSSARGKATICYLVMMILGWLQYVGQNQPSKKTFPFIMLLLGFLFSLILYRRPKIGVTTIFIFLLANIIFIVAVNPSMILGAIIALYLFFHFIYPAYQVEKYNEK